MAYTAQCNGVLQNGGTSFNIRIHTELMTLMGVYGLLIYCKVFLGTALLNSTPLAIYGKLHAPGGVGQDHVHHHFV